MFGPSTARRVQRGLIWKVTRNTNVEVLAKLVGCVYSLEDLWSDIYIHKYEKIYKYKYIGIISITVRLTAYNLGGFLGDQATEGGKCLRTFLHRLESELSLFVRGKAPDKRLLD